jgi:hypothetical protein
MANKGWGGVGHANVPCDVKLMKMLLNSLSLRCTTDEDATQLTFLVYNR